MKNSDIVKSIELYGNAVFSREMFHKYQNEIESYERMPAARRLLNDLKKYEKFVPLRIRKNLPLNEKDVDRNLAKKCIDDAISLCMNSIND